MIQRVFFIKNLLRNIGTRIWYILIFFAKKKFSEFFFRTTICCEDISSDFFYISFGKSYCAPISILIEITDDFFLEKRRFFIEISESKIVTFSQKISHLLINPIFQLFAIVDKAGKCSSIFWIDGRKFWKDVMSNGITQILCVSIWRIFSIENILLRGISEKLFFR